MDGEPELDLDPIFMRITISLMGQSKRQILNSELLESLDEGRNLAAWVHLGFLSLCAGLLWLLFAYTAQLVYKMPYGNKVSQGPCSLSNWKWDLCLKIQAFTPQIMFLCFWHCSCIMWRLLWCHQVSGKEWAARADNHLRNKDNETKSHTISWAPKPLKSIGVWPP